MISLHDVSKVYHTPEGEVRALDTVSLSVDQGQFVAVRGSSGCGKSTLLLTVGGMVRPTAGQVLLDGQDVYAMSARARAAMRAARIGFIFQMFHLIPYLNVLENVLTPSLAARRAGRREARELLDRFNMSDRLGHRPSELSTGERQRVAIARALLNRPDIILADEPTGNLDPDNAREVMDYLADFHREGGTVLVVTHDRLADDYAQQTVLIAHGRITPLGDAETGLVKQRD